METIQTEIPFREKSKIKRNIEYDTKRLHRDIWPHPRGW